MAFNNPSSRTPVSYAGATKSLGYLFQAAKSAFSRDDDDGLEDAALLRKKKGASKENRCMVMSCCVCFLVLFGVVFGFVYMLQHLTYPHPVPRPPESHGSGPSFGTSFSQGRKGSGSRGRSQRGLEGALDQDFDVKRQPRAVFGKGSRQRRCVADLREEVAGKRRPLAADRGLPKRSDNYTWECRGGRGSDVGGEGCATTAPA
ncbi:hypothetical protein T484DRAFT_2113166 [Baffinella frigidus]|nr:hypothetical protein T484DRAFT_2113166 [Cryptophyta sp. CCMP2293]